MRRLRLFEDFMDEGIIRKTTPNKERARSLIAESERKMHSLKEQLEKIGIKDENANDYVEHCYDIIMHLIRAKLYLEGYSVSGQGAHEAEISYLRVLKFTENDVRFMDQMRYFRNGMLYYGNVFDKEYADKALEFMNRACCRLKELLKT